MIRAGLKNFGGGVTQARGRNDLNYGPSVISAGRFYGCAWTGAQASSLAMRWQPGRLRSSRKCCFVALLGRMFEHGNRMRQDRIGRCDMIPILNTTLIISMFLVSTAFSFYDRGGSFDGLSVGNDNHAKMIAAESELKMADLSTSGSRTKSLPAGLWGGKHISMEVTSQRATVEYDCAHAVIEQRIVIDRRGRFNVSGMQFPERGGPVRQDQQASGYPVRFTGRINGKTMTLSVSNNLTKEAIGTFTLVHGAEPKLMKCK